MKFKKYLKESEVFLSKNFFKDKEDEREIDLKGAVEQFIKATNDLDAIKKSKFYGKDYPEGFTPPEASIENIEEVFRRDSDESEQNLHAVIGICTEAGELLESMYSHKWKGEDYDAVNAREEIGDVLWYMAILFRNFKWSIYKVFKINILKLKGRYDKKFSKDKAINRDLNAERKILEK